MKRTWPAHPAPASRAGPRRSARTLATSATASRTSPPRSPASRGPPSCPCPCRRPCRALRRRVTTSTATSRRRSARSWTRRACPRRCPLSRATTASLTTSTVVSLFLSLDVCFLSPGTVFGPAMVPFPTLTESPFANQTLGTPLASLRLCLGTTSRSSRGPCTRSTTRSRLRSEPGARSTRHHY